MIKIACMYFILRVKSIHAIFMTYYYWTEIPVKTWAISMDRVKAWSGSTTQRVMDQKRPLLIVWARTGHSTTAITTRTFRSPATMVSISDVSIYRKYRCIVAISIHRIVSYRPTRCRFLQYIGTPNLLGSMFSSYTVLQVTKNLFKAGSNRSMQ